MATGFGNGITLASGFDLGSQSPLDSRTTVKTLEDLDTHVKNNRAYEGLMVYVENEKSYYQCFLNDNNELSWKKFSSVVVEYNEDSGELSFIV